MILHSCEGTENPTNKSMAARKALQQYADAGGRVFASHWHNYWFEHGPAPWPTVANFHHQADLAIPFTATIDTSFQRGADGEVADERRRLDDVGQLVIRGAQHTIDTVGTGRQWIYSTSPQSVQYLDATTPFTGPGLRARGAQRHPRLAGRLVVDGGRFGPEPGLSRRLPDDGAVAAGEGAGVHDLRPVVVRGDHRIVSG